MTQHFLCKMKAFNFLKHFGKCSGLNINKDKTTVIVLGPQHGDNKKVCGIKCANEPPKTLGVWLDKQNKR